MDQAENHLTINYLVDILNTVDPKSWLEIDNFLESLKNSDCPFCPSNQIESFGKSGIAFLTYDYGIDGVSIEISKYARAIQNLFSKEDQVNIHFIGGDFFPQADSVLEPNWKRFQIQGINGWSKWDNGKWFEMLYYKDIPENSKVSIDLAKEMWDQAVIITKKLGDFIIKNNINLIIPVNISSNPGNLALGIAVVMITEILNLYVINSCHDYYWESGKPASERLPGEEAGPRDHFFRNINNKEFFNFFKKLYPWNGKRWSQVNINHPQSENLINKFGFKEEQVSELSTSLSDKFFLNYSSNDVKSARLRMAHILSDGGSVINPVNIEEHIKNIDNWMTNQTPVVCAYKNNLNLDITSEKTIYFLQPTRIINRKRIEKDLEFINAILKHPEFYNDFINDEEKQIVLHITGPVPIEHKADLMNVLEEYINTCSNFSTNISERIFLAFSVGNENHHSFNSNGFEKLCIEEIYRLATMIVFPSETEGRGLPIVESAACGIPIICSRYFPEEVFAGVIGEHLDEDLRIKYFEFPEEEFTIQFLEQITEYLLNPGNFTEFVEHNKKAVMLRYGAEIMQTNLKELFTNFFI